ncbi:hypothetical protein Tco_1167187 [Tanacetum coccineum]
MVAGNSSSNTYTINKSSTVQKRNCTENNLPTRMAVFQLSKNMYFPFNIKNETAHDVSTDMIMELDINDLGQLSKLPNSESNSGMEDGSWYCKQVLPVMILCNQSNKSCAKAHR